VFSFIYGRWLNPDKIWIEYLEQRRLILAAFIASLVAIANLLSIFIIKDWKAVGLLWLSGLTLVLTAWLIYRATSARKEYLKWEIDESIAMSQYRESTPWKDGLLQDIASWANLNGVVVRCAVEERGTAPHIIHFSFDNVDDQILFKLKWL
jgi:hypothetical protein